MTELRVPKRDLIAAAQAALGTKRLKIAADLPHAQTLTDELRSFRVRIDPKTAHDSYNAETRVGAHDDLVLSVALAVWWREDRALHWDHTIRTAQDRFRHERLEAGEPN